MTNTKDSIENVMRDFYNTDLYTSDFLADLERGLRDSSWDKES